MVNRLLHLTGSFHASSETGRSATRDPEFEEAVLAVQPTQGLPREPYHMQRTPELIPAYLVWHSENGTEFKWKAHQTLLRKCCGQMKRQVCASNGDDDISNLSCKTRRRAADSDCSNRPPTPFDVAAKAAARSNFVPIAAVRASRVPGDQDALGDLCSANI
ncbi:uncharacterized protein LOC126376720 [Pectinophora gossypiella]|nr:uncharacterized protein LOC126376720 [Pectinophora gossypiella]